MKKAVLIIIGLFLINPLLRAQDELSFASGEKLNYEMSYGWITGGKATLEVKETIFDNKKVFYARALGYTVGVTDKLYNVVEVYETYFDKTTCMPHKSIENVKEGNYKRYTEVVFDQAKMVLKSTKSGEKKMTHNMFDIISAFYALRQENIKNLKTGQIITLKAYFQDGPWDLVIRYKGTEKIKTSYGKINCYKFKPIVEKGLFDDEDALSLWISADDNKIPVRIEMGLYVGSFKVDLTNYSGLKYPIVFEK